MFDEFDDDLIDAAVDGNTATGGLLPPREMADCIGHEKQEKQLAGLIADDRLPHALILAGPKGIGKSTMAFRLARYLFDKGGAGGGDAGPGLFGDDLPADKPESLYVAPDAPAFQRVASGGHTDLLYVQRQFDEKKGRFKGGVDVDEVRKITPFMRMTASQDGGWRVAIIDDADTMTRNAQNAILKILEEPPQRGLLILVTHRPGRLVATIRSRCRTMNFHTPHLDDFAEVIKREHPAMPESEIGTLYGIADGSIGHGLQIVEEGGLEVIGNIVALLENHQQWDWPQIHKLADGLSRNGQEDSMATFQDVFLWVIDTIVKCKARGQGLPKVMDSPKMQELHRHFNLKQWIDIADRLRGHFDTANFASLDKRYAVLGAFSFFEQAA